MKRLAFHCLLCLGITRQSILCSECRRLCLNPTETQLDDALVLSLGSFNAGLRTMILHLKHRRDGKVGVYLGQQLARHFPVNCPIDAVTWVPSQTLNRIKRGGDASAHIAQGFAQAIQRPAEGLLDPRLQWHGRHRSRAQRQLGQFKVRSNQLGYVALIDDVFVTGKTLAGAKQALEAAGIRVAMMLTAAQR